MAWYDKLFSEKTQSKFVKNKKKIYTLLLSFAIVEIIILINFPPNESEQMKDKKKQEQVAAKEEKEKGNVGEQTPDTYSQATNNVPTDKLKPNDKMGEVYHFARKNKQHGLMATVADGMPRVRGMSLVQIVDDKWYFATSKKKAISKQIRDYPYAEWITYNERNISLRVLGKITIVDDVEIKQQAVNDVPSLQRAYGDKVETEFDLFYMEVIEVNWYGR